MIDPKHPRADPLRTRDQIVDGVKQGITSTHGLIAQGRGEAFDYLLGEKTQPFAQKALKQATLLLLSAKHPVLSINGNTAALVPQAFVELAKELSCPIEINLFHRTLQRERAIQAHLRSFGAETILGVGDTASSEIAGIASPRKYVSPHGIAQGDVVFVPLEDGDRTEALIKNGKKVIAVDLNPLSRTAQMATVTIVDNIVRALPTLLKLVKKYQAKDATFSTYDNKQVLKQAVSFITKRFSSKKA